METRILRYVHEDCFAAYLAKDILPRVCRKTIKSARNTFRRWYGAIDGVGRIKKTRYGFKMRVTGEALSQLPETFEMFESYLKPEDY